MATEVVNHESAQQEQESRALAAPAPLPPRQTAIPVVFDPGDPVALYMNTDVFAQLQRVAKLMCSSGLVPVHLRGADKQADCFLVAAQAFRWRMDPFSVAQHTYVLSGKLGYEGKLIAALINASGKLAENLKPVYAGEKGTPQRRVTIVGVLKAGGERSIDGTVAEWQTTNAKWKEIPDQMLFYRGAREWARRHMPEVVLGIQAEEELVEAPAAAPRPRTLDALTERIETVKTVNPEPSPAQQSQEAADEQLAEMFARSTEMPAPAPPIAEAACKHEKFGPKGVPAGKTFVCPDCQIDVKGPWPKDRWRSRDEKALR